MISRYLSLACDQDDDYRVGGAPIPLANALERTALDDRVKLKFLEFLIDIKADRVKLD